MKAGGMITTSRIQVAAGLYSWLVAQDCFTDSGGRGTSLSSRVRGGQTVQGHVDKQ